MEIKEKQMTGTKAVYEATTAKGVIEVTITGDRMYGNKITPELDTLDITADEKGKLTKAVIDGVAKMSEIRFKG